MLKIWGRTNSGNVQKVMWTVAELGIAHERIDAGMKFGGVNEPWYRAMNPNGLIPTIQDGKLSPSDLAARADADRWMEWCSTTVGPAVSPIFVGLIRTAPEQRDTKAIEQAREKMIKHAATLDAHLADKRFVTGDTFTMGDIPLGCFVNRWYDLPIERPHYPNLVAWHRRLSERPAFRQHVMIPFD
jgi:glutathione S-transferase